MTADVPTLAAEITLAEFDVIETPLSRLVGLDALQKVQDRFAALGQVTACIGSCDGQLITKPTWGSRYSRLVSNSPLGREAFLESIRLCCLEPHASIPSICHAGMTLYTSPITHEMDCLGILVVGTRPVSPMTEVQLRALSDLSHADLGQLRAAASELQPWTSDTLEATYQFANVLADTIATLFGQAERIERQLRDLQAVHGLSDLIAGTRDVQEILDVCVHRVVEAMHVKAAAIRLLNEDTGELVIRAVHNLSDEYVKKGPVTLKGNYIDSAAFAGHAVYIENAPTDPRLRYPDNARREGIVSGLCVPMTYRGRTVGVLRAYTGGPHVFSESEQTLLMSIGSLTASAIINSKLFEEQASAVLLHQQLEAAAEIQRNMLPSGLPKHANLEFGCVYEPTLRVSGDFYDFLSLHGGYLGVTIADVVGKGIPAALRMASVRSTLRAFANVGYDLHTVIELVNRQVCRETQSRDFVTLSYGVFSPDGRLFNYCNAGHVPPLLVRDGKVIELNAGGLVIGVRPREAYDEEPVVIRPGDLIVMVTDGVTEALNYSHEPYSNERFIASLLKHQSLGASSLARQLLWDVRSFVGLAEQSDDITIVVIKAL